MTMLKPQEDTVESPTAPQGADIPTTKQYKSESVQTEHIYEEDVTEATHQYNMEQQQATHGYEENSYTQPCSSSTTLGPWRAIMRT